MFSSEMDKSEYKIVTFRNIFIEKSVSFLYAGRFVSTLVRAI